MANISWGRVSSLLNNVEKIKKILKNGAEFTIVYFDEANSESKMAINKNTRI